MNIFVTKLSSNTNAVMLESLFARFGEVEDAKVVYDRHTGDSKGYGFIQMAREEDAEKAIEALNETEFDGKVIIVKKAEPPKKKFGPRF